jgi:hypothetical protein
MLNSAPNVDGIWRTDHGTVVFDGTRKPIDRNVAHVVDHHRIGKRQHSTQAQRRPSRMDEEFSEALKTNCG